MLYIDNSDFNASAKLCIQLTIFFCLEKDLMKCRTIFIWQISNQVFCHSLWIRNQIPDQQQPGQSHTSLVSKIYIHSMIFEYMKQCVSNFVERASLIKPSPTNCLFNVKDQCPYWCNCESLFLRHPRACEHIHVRVALEW